MRVAPTIVPTVEQKKELTKLSRSNSLRIKETDNVSDICVAHLIRKKNGLEPFRNFLDSYLKHPAGIDHDLLIVYKGFYRRAEMATYEELLKEIPHSCLRVADFGFDLRPYFIAAKKHHSKYFCFLNSFSIILDKDWLLKLYRQISQPGVGLAGATGSWGSIRPGREAKHELPWYKKLARKWLGTYFGIYFERFPNYHIRTNGFMITRDNMLKIRRGIILTKMHAWILESGKSSITRQIERLGLRPVVVGKDGKGYDKHEWDVSNTFRRGTQNNLLISDNQTRKFDAASPEWRRNGEIFAWGKLANVPRDNMESK